MHAYFDVDPALVWEIIHTELSGLKGELIAILDEEDASSEGRRGAAFFPLT